MSKRSWKSFNVSLRMSLQAREFLNTFIWNSSSWKLEFVTNLCSGDLHPLTIVRSCGWTLITYPYVTMAVTDVRFLVSGPIYPTQALMISNSFNFFDISWSRKDLNPLKKTRRFDGLNWSLCAGHWYKVLTRAKVSAVLCWIPLLVQIHFPRFPK